MADTAVATPAPEQTAPVAPPTYGEATHEGVTVFSNQQTTEQMRESIAKAPAEKKPNPRRDLAARVQQQSGELANKDQAIDTLNARLSEIDTLKKEIEALKAPKAQPQTAPLRPVPPAADPSGFAEKEPTLEQFAQSDDPYRDYVRALSAFDRRKEAFDAKQTTDKQQFEQAARQSDAQFDTFIKTKQAEHDGRLGQFIATKPEAKAIMEAAGALPLTPLMVAAIELGDRGPEFMLELAQHPELVDELVLQTAGQPVFDARRNMNPLVSVLQRRLTTRLGAAVAGSAPERKSTLAHPPINPVVGSQPAATSGPPGDDASFEEHEAYWNRVERESRRGKR